MTTLEYRLYPKPGIRNHPARTAAPQPYPRHQSRPAGRNQSAAERRLAAMIPPTVPAPEAEPTPAESASRNSPSTPQSLGWTVRTPHNVTATIHTFLYPHGELAERTRKYAAQRIADQAILRDHLPVWRWRIAIALGFIPVLWMFPRCRHQDCPNRWPCKPLLGYLRRIHGWTCEMDRHLHNLSTKRRRRRAGRRNPTAVSHRAISRHRRFAAPR